MSTMIPLTKGTIPFPYDIVFVDSAASPAVRSGIEDSLLRLCHFYDRITFARVYVRIPHKHKSIGRQFHVHIQLDVPGRRIAASRETETDDRNMDIHHAVRDAFSKVTRQLEDFVKHRNNKKMQPPPEVIAI